MECFFFENESYMVSFGCFTVDETLGSQCVTGGMTVLLRRKLPKVNWFPLWQIQWWGRWGKLTTVMVSLFLFQVLKCPRSWSPCLPLNLFCFFLCSSVVSKIKLISVLVIRKPDIEVQQGLLDGFLFNIFNKEYIYRVKVKNKNQNFSSTLSYAMTGESLSLPPKPRSLLP